MEFPDSMTLGEAREQLRDLVEEGHKCPCCSQLAKVYARSLNHQNVRVLATMLRYGKRDWVHVGTLLKEHLADIAHQGGHATIAGYWRLIEEERTLREDGGRAGFWRLTDTGEAWVRGEVAVPKYARTYDTRVLGYDGPEVFVRDAVKERFDYGELMAGIPVAERQPPATPMPRSRAQRRARPTPEPFETAPCAYPRHRHSDWRMPQSAPSHMRGSGRWVCGICHPPPYPEEFELSVEYGAEKITIRLERREGVPA